MIDSRWIRSNEMNTTVPPSRVSLFSHHIDLSSSLFYSLLFINDTKFAIIGITKILNLQWIQKLLVVRSIESTPIWIILRRILNDVCIFPRFQDMIAIALAIRSVVDLVAAEVQVLMRYRTLVLNRTRIAESCSEMLTRCVYQRPYTWPLRWYNVHTAADEIGEFLGVRRSRLKRIRRDQHQMVIRKWIAVPALYGRASVILVFFCGLGFQSVEMSSIS